MQKSTQTFLLLFKHTDQSLLKEIDVKFTNKRVTSNTKDVKHLKRPKSTDTMSTIVIESVLEISNDGCKGRIGNRCRIECIRSRKDE